MTGNNNTYYKSSMYENRGENTAQEIIIALAIAVISLLLAGVIISHFQEVFQVAAIMVQEIAQEMVDTVIMMAVAAVDM